MTINFTPSASFTRPNDVTPYSANDMVANSIVAAAVIPLTFNCSAARSSAGLRIIGATLKKSTVTATLASFNLHLFKRFGSQEVVNAASGDNLAFRVLTLNNYLGYIPLDLATGGAVIATSGELAKMFAAAAPLMAEIPELVVYGLLEATAAYVPAANEIFTVGLHCQVG